MYKAKVALPPAEGAEEYLRSKITDDLTFNAFDIKQAYPIWLLAKWIEEFATIHAQQMAEKMVEERMEQYKAQFKDRPNPVEVNPYDSKGIKRIRNRKTH